MVRADVICAWFSDRINITLGAKLILHVMQIFRRKHISLVINSRAPTKKLNVNQHDMTKCNLRLEQDNRHKKWHSKNSSENDKTFHDDNVFVN